MIYRDPKDLLTHKRFDIVNNPLYHLYYQGLKYVSLDVIKNMKTLRNEPKDITDVQLMETIRG